MSGLVAIVGGAVAGFLSSEALHAWGRRHPEQRDETVEFERAREALRKDQP